MAKMECKGCVYLTFLNNNKDLGIRYYVCLFKMKCPFYFSSSLPIEELEVNDEENPEAETDKILPESIGKDK